MRAPDATDVPAPDAAAAAAARERLASLATPPGALGRLGELAVWWAGVRGVPVPPAPRRVDLHVVAGDHGVVARGVSAFPAAVTPLMVRAFLDGGAAATVLARQLGVHVHTHDLAVDTDWPPGTDPALTAHKVRRGSGSIDTDDALTPEETDAALAAGAALADASVDAGADLLLVGDMGIGNTTPAAALVCALLDGDPAVLTGRGTGVDGDALARKREVVTAAVTRARDAHGDDPRRLLGGLGGADLAAMAGLCARAARRRTPVLLDGVVVTAAALAAERAAPGSAAWWAAGHRSAEPAHSPALVALGLDPLLDLGMRLGEGSGALAALPLLSSAATLLAETALLADVLPG
ncbi:nicotinate-nucleotide--dimethylbenzimidazole phosphoribosyltransferase [Aquipuribacter nitratireducens]|uniref:Nicotinate-nucleotide--dimethylbenzimidazole phosphoribosyltransferase n=1 Tax=Aquipuribacter nitratireducens TaxID=650104 RepID=A0ABW0GJB0_9MICO